MTVINNKKKNKKTLYIIMTIFWLIVLILFILFCRQYYYETYLLKHENKLYSYQEGIVMYNEDNGKVEITADTSIQDYGILIYENGKVIISYYESGTSNIIKNKYLTISKKDLNKIKKTIDKINPKEISEFIFNGYLDGRGYEFSFYKNGKEIKTISGFGLTKSSETEFSDLQKENYKDTIDDEIKFNKIKNILLNYTLVKKVNLIQK